MADPVSTENTAGLPCRRCDHSLAYHVRMDLRLTVAEPGTRGRTLCRNVYECTADECGCKEYEPPTGFQRIRIGVMERAGYDVALEAVMPVGLDGDVFATHLLTDEAVLRLAAQPAQGIDPAEHAAVVAERDKLATEVKALSERLKENGFATEDSAELERLRKETAEQRVIIADMEQNIQNRDAELVALRDAAKMRGIKL